MDEQLPEISPAPTSTPRGPYKKKKKKPSKKKVSAIPKKSPILAEKSSLQVLYYTEDCAIYAEEINSPEDLQIQLLKVFTDFPKLEEVYLLKAVKLFKKPVYETIDL
jgi:hypothetical protein